MMDWLKNMTDEAKKSVLDQVSRFKNREFLEAVVAGCALVAAADGSIKPEEKQKMMGFIQRSPELKVFSTADVVSVYNAHAETLAFDLSIGRMEAMRVIARLKKNPGAARAMVTVCCSIGAADGDFDGDEKKAVKEICSALDIPPAEFGL